MILSENEKVHKRAVQWLPVTEYKTGVMSADADSLQAGVEFTHQMNHKDYDSGSGHIPTKQWTDTIDPFCVSHEQVFRLQECFVMDRIESADRAFTRPALHFQPADD